jgi:hypothetical protein
MAQAVSTILYVFPKRSSKGFSWPNGDFLMGATIYKQPDGLFCRYSTVIDDFTHINMTREALFAALRESHLERWEASLNEDFDRVEKTGLSAPYTIRQDGRFDTLEDKIKTIEDIHGVEYAEAAAKALGFEKVTYTVHPTTVGKLSSSRSNQQHPEWEQDSAGHYYQKQNGLCVEALADGRWQAVGPQGSSVHNTVSEAQAAALGHCKGAVPERSLVESDDLESAMLYPRFDSQTGLLLKAFVLPPADHPRLLSDIDQMAADTSQVGRRTPVPSGYMCDKKHVFPEGSTYSRGQSYCSSCDCWMYVYSPEGEKQFPT